MTTPEMIKELREMQKQVIHGPTLFGEVADRLEAMQQLLVSIASEKPVKHAQPDGSVDHPPK